MMKTILTRDFGDAAYVDDSITRAESVLAIKALNEQMWGGERGQGLIYAIADLSKTVTKLAETVTTLSADIHGGTGLQITLSKLEADFGGAKKKIEMFESWLWKVVGTILFIAIGMAAVLVRIGANIAAGK